MGLRFIIRKVKWLLPPWLPLFALNVRHISIRFGALKALHSTDCFELKSEENETKNKQQRIKQLINDGDR